jgi:hypothetical protein
MVSNSPASIFRCMILEFTNNFSVGVAATLSRLQSIMTYMDVATLRANMINLNLYQYL